MGRCGHLTGQTKNEGHVGCQDSARVAYWVGAPTPPWGPSNMTGMVKIIVIWDAGISLT